MFGNTAPGTAIVTGISWLSWPRLIFITLSLIKTAPDILLTSVGPWCFFDITIALLQTCQHSTASQSTTTYTVDIIENRQVFNSSNWNSRTHCSMLIKYPFILQTFITFDIQTFWGHISSVSPVVLECKCVMVSGCGPPRPAPGCLGGLLGSLIWRHYCSYRVSRTLSRHNTTGGYSQDTDKEAAIVGL